jgi:hypothetical protein
VPDFLLAAVEAGLIARLSEFEESDAQLAVATDLKFSVEVGLGGLERVFWVALVADVGRIFMRPSRKLEGGVPSRLPCSPPARKRSPSGAGLQHPGRARGGQDDAIKRLKRMSKRSPAVAGYVRWATAWALISLTSKGLNVERKDWLNRTRSRS